MKMQKGFTLIELMLVVTIIGILAAVAIPAYNDYIIRGRLVDGTAALADGKVRLEQYYQDNIPHTYAGGPVPDETPNFTYALDGTEGANGFNLVATGKGSVADFSYGIDQTSTKTTITLKSGWGTAPANCWITTRGGTC
jgi:type IV pilus assembly protein PilE